MARERIIVATDTGSSMTRQEAEAKGVALVPLHLVWPPGRRQDTDFTITSDELYESMERRGIPTTSGATPPDFKEFYEELYRQGARQVASIHVTSQKSITCDSARWAAEEIMGEHEDLTIEVVDSMTVSSPQLFLAQEAVEMVDRGMSLGEVGEELERLIPQTRLYAAIPDIEHLKASGRVSGLRARVGSLLKFAPVVEVSEGDIVLAETPRTASRARQRVLERVGEDIEEMGPPTRLGVVYTKDKELGESFAEELIALEGLTGFRGEVDLREAGSILGVHAGPGAVAVSALYRPPAVNEI